MLYWAEPRGRAKCAFLSMRWIWVMLALPSCAQNWDSLRGLKSGDAVVVTERTGREVKGSFRAVSADAIQVETSGGEVSVERPQVRKVKMKSASRRARNVAIGAAAGIAIGVTVDQTLGTRLRNEGNESGRAAMYAAPIGLLAGVPALLPAYVTVYQVK